MLHSMTNPLCRRLEFRLDRILRTQYRIDRFQHTYFVIDSFEKQVADTAHDFTLTYERIRDRPVLSPDEPAPDDIEVPLVAQSK